MTTDITQERIRKVLSGVMAPLARTLLRCGVSYTEFADLSKRAFVEAASSDYGVRNRPTNIARVAVMTGLSRKEVSRIRREGKRKRSDHYPSLTLPATVLEVWHTNKRYLQRSGVPKMLPFSGGTASFFSLVKSVSSDIPPGAMRQELLRVGAIRIVDRQFLVPAKRHFIPDSAVGKLIFGLELGLRRLAETIAFNSDYELAGKTRFQRFIEGPAIDIAELPSIRSRLDPLLAKFSLEIDDFLSSYGHGNKKIVGKGKSRRAQMGVGVYYFDDSEQ